MPDIIITPSSGKLEFVDTSAQSTRRHSFTMDANDGLNLDAHLSAAAISAPLNVINVTVNNSNANYPFVLAQSGETGAKNLLMDGAGGTYNPFTNTATIDISGNSATTTLASNSTNLGGVAAASYVTLTGTQTLTNKTITGTFTGNLTGTGSWATNALNANTATNATQLNGQAASYYTNIPARLGYTPVNQAGDTISGNLTVNGNFAVNGSVTAFSASNIYITSSTLTVTDNILLMNALSPYQRYAGIQMYDSGSNTLSQFLWDGEGDYFFLTGSSVNGKIITGPDGQTNLTANYIPKATAGYKLGNSLIYDNGTNVGIGTTSPTTPLHVVGVISGSSFSGAGTGLTGTASGLSIGGNAATVTNGAYLNTSQTFTAVSTFAVPSRTTSYTTPSIQVYTGDNTPPGIAFHRGGVSATYLYESDGELYTNPWTTRGQTGKLLAAGNYTDYTVTKTGTGASGTWAITSSWATNAVNVNNATLTVAAGTGISLSATPTFTSNASVDKTITITNGGVTSLTTNTGLSSNVSATGAVTVTNTGVTSNVAGTGISVSGATGAVTITNSGVTSAVAGTGVSVSGATGAVTFSIGQAVGTGNSPTFTAITTSTDGANLVMAGTTNAEGIRMTPASSTTYPVFLRSINPAVGEASPWIYKEQATDWGIWHNNPVNSIDFTKQGSGGIANNVGGSSTNTVTVRVEMATGFVQTIAGYRNSAGTTILDNSGNITGNSATVGSLSINTSGRNDVANQIVRTDSNGYIQAGWINTTSGDQGTSAIDRVYASYDGYIRYYTPANFRTVLDVPTRGGSGASGTWAITSSLATTANALNTSNSYTVTSLTATSEVGTRGSNIGVNLERGDSTIATLRFDADNFRIWGGGTGGIGEILRVTETGNVGIGTTSATARLHVSGSTGGVFEVDTANGATTLYVSASGNIGIGTTNPTAKLQIGTNSISAVSDNSVITRIGSSSAGGRVFNLTLANTATATVSNDSSLSFIVADNYSATSIISAILRNVSTAATDLIFTNYNTSLQERMRIQYDGNVGIGTSSPSWLLTVYAATTPQFTLQNGTRSFVLTNNSADNLLSFNYASVNRLQFDTTNQWFNTGNVGIGSTSPGSKLDVTGAIRGDAGVNYPHSFTNTDAGNTHWTNRGDRLLTSNGTNWAGDGKDPIMALVTSGNTNATTIANSIGLALHNESTTDNTFSPAIVFSNRSNSTSYNTAYAAIIGRKTGQGVDSNWSAGELHFYTMPAGAYVSNIPSMLIRSDGNVGIGTNTVTAKVESYYSSNAITFNYLATNLNNTSPIPVYGFDVTNGVGETRSIKAGIGYERHETNGRGTLHFYNRTTNDTASISGNRSSAGDIKMSLNNNGNVGIGTSNPATLLHVDTAGSDARIRVSAGTNTVQGGMIANTGTSLVYAGSITNHGFSLRTNDTDRVRIQTDGNVGIGSTAPNDKLDVVGRVYAYRYIAVSSNASLPAYATDTNTGMFNAATNQIGFSISSAEKVRIDSNGNVGIGTSNPGRKLDVEGIVRTRGASGTGGFEISAATTGTAKWRIEWDSASDSLDFNWVG